MAETTRSGTSRLPAQGAAAGSSGRPDRRGYGGAGLAVEETGARTATEARKIGGELACAVRDRALLLLDDQRSRAADQIAAVGEALKRSAQSLEKTSGPTVVGYADRAAEQIVGLADTVRNRPLGDVAADIEDFARRWPVAFMAAAVGIGFAAGRILLASGGAGTHPSRPTKMAPGGSE